MESFKLIGTPSDNSLMDVTKTKFLVEKVDEKGNKETILEFDVEQNTIGGKSRIQGNFTHKE